MFPELSKSLNISNKFSFEMRAVYFSCWNIDQLKIYFLFLFGNSITYRCLFKVN